MEWATCSGQAEATGVTSEEALDLGRIEGYWDERSVSYGENVRGELAGDLRLAWRERLSRVTADLAPANGGRLRVLELGCGPAFLSVILAELGCQVDALDGSAEMLVQAERNVRAAGVGDAVTLHRGDATDTRLSSSTYDLVVSRNLTWVLLDPKAAYREWLRLLAPGGRLAVFDAEWYRYLVDEEVDQRRRADQRDVSVLGWDEDERATPHQEDACERMARGLPLTYERRPAWDVVTLGSLGYESIESDTDAWRTLWTAGERRYYRSSPLFMLCADKSQ